MNRRTWCKILVLISLLPLLWRHWLKKALAGGEAQDHAPRIRPSDPRWPAAEKWEKLNQEVGGNLITVESPLAACKATPDSASCQEIIKNLQNPYFIGDQPGASQSAGWVDAWDANPSAYAVAARNTADVVAAVNFARKNNMRLVVKGGGHSYQGTSTSADSLMIWTRAMNVIEMHDKFVGQGCEGSANPQPAVTIGAGAMWIDAYHAVTTINGRYVQGGGCATVGVAGLIQSGGFGSFSKNFGTAAASLLEAEIVTADGEVRTTNACINSDLFWAIKGGGGGSLGAVTRLTLKTHELPPLFGIVNATIKASSDEAFRLLIGRFIDFYRQELFNPHWGESVTFRPERTLAIAMVFQGFDKQQAASVWQPFLDWLTGHPQELSLTAPPLVQSLPARKWWDANFLKNVPNIVFIDQRPGSPETHMWYTSNEGEVGMFWHGYESVWLPAFLLEKEQQSQLADTLFSCSKQWKVALHFNKGLGGGSAEAIAATKETAMNPQVLNAFALAIIAGGTSRKYPGINGYGPDLAFALADAHRIKESMLKLRSIVPEAGAYVSESSFFEHSWQQSFWGANYPRLSAAKKKYDPNGLFFVHHGVGSEEWSADGFTPNA